MKDLRLNRDIDRLNNRLSILWPDGDGDGNGHGGGNNNNDDIKKAFIDTAERYWFDEYKRNFIFHKSSCYWRGLKEYDGQGCNSRGCVPECPFYPEEGRMRPLPPKMSYEEYVAQKNPHIYVNFQNWLERHHDYMKNIHINMNTPTRVVRRNVRYSPETPDAPHVEFTIES